MFWFFGRDACGILAHRPAIEAAAPALEGKVLSKLQGKAMRLRAIGSMGERWAGAGRPPPHAIRLVGSLHFVP